MDHKRYQARHTSLTSVIIWILVLAMQISGTRCAVAEGVRAEGTPEALDTDNLYAWVVRPKDGVEGDYLTVNGEAGTSHELTVVLGNANSTPFMLTTYIADVVPKTNGGFALEPLGATADGVASWADYPTETYKFEGGQGIERTFRVSIPPDTKPGHYIAGIVIENAETIDVPGNASKSQIIQKAMALFVVVPGEEIPGMSIQGGELVGSNLNYSLRNTGNVLLKPKVNIAVRSEDGELVAQDELQMRSVYPGQEVPIVIVIPPILPDGSYTVEMRVEDEKSGVTASGEAFSIELNRLAPPDTLTLQAEMDWLPDATAPVYGEVSVVATNRGEVIESGELLLEVYRDGELIEKFPLASSLALQQGETQISQRYIPAEGFTTGIWTFALTMNAIDPASQATTTIATYRDFPELVIP